MDIYLMKISKTKTLLFNTKIYPFPYLRGVAFHLLYDNVACLLTDNSPVIGNVFLQIFSTGGTLEA